jgi:CheY-like chemotaxis protein
MHDLNQTLDQLMHRLSTRVPGASIETRKSYRDVPAQAFDPLVDAIEGVLTAASEKGRVRKIRLENGFSTIGEGFSGLMSSGAASFSYIAADVQFSHELSGELLPFAQYGMESVHTLSTIAERNGGFLQVETASSDTLRFTLRLPIASAETWQLTTGVYGGREAILLVEDEEFVRNVTQEVLEMEGFKVFPVPNGAEALDLIACQHPHIDLLLTDVVLPGMNGRDLATRLCAARPEMKVILMSGYTDNPVLKRCVAETTTLYLQKPFTLDTLIAKVHEALEVFPVAALAQRAALSEVAELR